jgi:hypothetical protein
MITPQICGPLKRRRGNSVVILIQGSDEFVNICQTAREEKCKINEEERTSGFWFPWSHHKFHICQKVVERTEMYLELSLIKIGR